MSASQEVYSGLSWVGRTEAKVFFIMMIAFYVLITCIILYQLFSNLHIVWNKNNYTLSQVEKAKQNVNQTIVAFLIISLIFGIIIFATYWNMKMTEKSKQYAAASGLVDVISDLRNL
jgi:hypothetical protein